MRFGTYFLLLSAVAAFAQNPAVSAARTKELAELQKSVDLLQRQVRTMRTGVDGLAGVQIQLPSGGFAACDSGATDVTNQLLAETIVLIGGEPARKILEKEAQGLTTSAVAHQRAQMLHDLIAAQKKGAK